MTACTTGTTAAGEIRRHVQLPSVTTTDANGKPVGTNCTICIRPVTAPICMPASPCCLKQVCRRSGAAPSYEIVKEEDKNILIGDDFIAPVTQEFGALGDIFIIPDQAQVGSAYNANNAQNPRRAGASPNNG